MPKLRMRVALPALVAVAAALAVSVSLATATTGKKSALPSGTYKIGFVESITGRLAFYDPVFAQGLKLGIDQINAKGGVGGKLKLQLIEKDGKSDPAQGAVIARELVDQGVQFLVTPCDADIGIPAAQIAQSKKIPVVMACGSGWTFPGIVGDYAFINVYGTAALGAAQAEFAITQGWKRAYNYLSSEYFYGKNIGDVFDARFKQLGGKTIGRGFYKFSDTDFRAIATSIAKLKPDVVTTTLVLPGQTTFLKQLRAQGYKGPVLGADSFDSKALFGAGSAANNIWFTTHACPTDARVKSFFAAFKKATGKAPDANFVATGGDLALQIQAALLAANSTDTKKVRDAYANLKNVQGISGLISYKGSPLPRVPKKDVFILKTQGRGTVCVTHFYPKKVPAIK